MSIEDDQMYSLLSAEEVGSTAVECKTTDDTGSESADPSSAITTLRIYSPIHKADTVFTTILTNLYKDTAFQKNITRLESGTEREKKKASVIQKTVQHIRVYGDKSQPLLLARDVGVLMGISNIKLQVKYYTSAEKIIGLYRQNNGKTNQVEFLTWKGFIRAASNSRSVLSDLFREFIYELVAEAIGDPTLLNTITQRVAEKNPELIDAAIDELDTNIDRYRILYEKERIKAQLIQNNLEKETQHRLVAEQKQIDAELDSLIQTHKTKQLATHLEHYEKKILQLYETPTSNLEIELSILKHRYMKPIYIYIPQAKVYNEWLGKKDPAYSDYVQYVPDYVDRVTYIMQRCGGLSKDGVSQYDAIRCTLLDNEYLYFYIHMHTNPRPSAVVIDDYIHVATEWVTDKRHYDAVVDELSKECEKLNTKKKTIYYSTLEEIRLIISQKLMEGESSGANTIY
jgi:transcription termination factor NusB